VTAADPSNRSAAVTAADPSNRSAAVTALMLLVATAGLAACRAPSTDRPDVAERPADGSLPAEPPGILSNAGTYRVAWTSSPSPIPLDAPFDLQLRVWRGSAAAEPDAVVVDARMPQHQHGMNVLPGLSAEPDGGYTARGLLFHMPGAWTVTVDVSEDGVTERAQWTVEL